MTKGAHMTQTMKLCEILSADRIIVDADGGVVHDKEEALSVLANLLSPSVGMSSERVLTLLSERERLQSTGIGDGVAIPHTAVESAAHQVAALLVCPRGIQFESADGAEVNIIIGVVGPRRATGDHLRILARISRLLRDEGTRAEITTSKTADSTFALIQAREAASA